MAFPVTITYTKPELTLVDEPGKETLLWQNQKMPPSCNKVRKETWQLRRAHLDRRIDHRLHLNVPTA